MKTHLIEKWGEMNWHCVPGVWILALCLCKVDGCLSVSAKPSPCCLSAALSSETGNIPPIMLTKEHPIFQLYPQPFGTEFRQSCLDLGKWGRKVEWEQDERDDSSLPVLSQKWGSLLSYSCQFVPEPDHKAPYMLSEYTQTSKCLGSIES